MRRITLHNQTGFRAVCGAAVTAVASLTCYYHVELSINQQVLSKACYRDSQT